MSIQDTDLYKAVKTLIDSFPSKGVTPGTMASYLENLSDLPEPLICSAIGRLIRTSTFLPAIAEIRELVVESCCGLPSEEEAWTAVRKVLGSAGTWRELLHPLVFEAAMSIGSWDLRHDEKGFASAGFRKLYREKRAALVKDMQAGVMPLPALSAGSNVTALVSRVA